MLKHKVSLIVLLAVAACAGALIYGKSGTDEKISTAPVKRIAPNFTLKDSKGVPHQLSDLRGNIIVLHFWASWCPPCLTEIPTWAELSTEFRGKPVKMMAVSLDQKWEDALKILPDEKAQGIVSVLDTDGKIPELFGTYQYPETYILSRDLEVVTKWIGPQDWKNPEILNFIQKLIDAKT